MQSSIKEALINTFILLLSLESALTFKGSVHKVVVKPIEISTIVIQLLLLLFDHDCMWHVTFYKVELVPSQIAKAQCLSLKPDEN